jgi:hypothetical protein
MSAHTLTVSTIAELRAKGWKVKVEHRRKIVPDMKLGLCSIDEYDAAEDDYITYDVFLSHMAERGGSTYVALQSPEGAVFEGEAFCHPKDNYSRKEGVRVAILKAFGLPYTPPVPKPKKEKKVFVRS